MFVLPFLKTLVRTFARARFLLFERRIFEKVIYKIKEKKRAMDDDILPHLSISLFLVTEKKESPP